LRSLLFSLFLWAAHSASMSNGTWVALRLN